MSTPVAIAGLQTWLTHPAQDPSTLAVFLHGFGAPGHDLVVLGRELPCRTPVRFAMPEAPIELGGMYGDSRAWWRIDMAALERDIASGQAKDRRNETPEGLASSRKLVLALIDELVSVHRPSKLVIGGFSQGAMLAMEVALHREQAPDALILMSGTLINSVSWTKRMSRLAKCQVMVSHGRRDQLLPFAVAEEMSDLLSAANADVTWIPFSGGHEIPPPVLAATASVIDGLSNG
jgi:phospholipase/carboxylesterase